MGKNKRIIFIGNRDGVFNEIQKEKHLEVIKVFVLENSLLSKKIDIGNNLVEVFSFKDKENVIKKIESSEFDILISNGCPFIIPVSKIKKENQLFINIHPTYLPFLKGKTGINGVLYNNMKYFGATVHLMDDNIDTGNIIYQKKIKVTKDLDLGLIYYISFEMEKCCFKKVAKILRNRNLDIKGRPQLKIGSDFNRTEDMMTIDINDNNSEEIIRKVKAFGIVGQGCKLMINNLQYIIYEADIITNLFLKHKFDKSTIGSILLDYDNKFLLKTIDGILKISRYEILS